MSQYFERLKVRNIERQNFRRTGYDTKTEQKEDRKTEIQIDGNKEIIYYIYEYKYVFKNK